MTAHADERCLVLWDIDHTLIETRGLGTQLYIAAFEAVTGRPMARQAEATGRTELADHVDFSIGAYGDDDSERAKLVSGSSCLAGGQSDDDVLKCSRVNYCRFRAHDLSFVLWASRGRFQAALGISGKQTPQFGRGKIPR